MPGKQGNLRIRKGTSQYGPMRHADLEKLLVAGRLAPCDQVSVSEGPWMSIGHYLATTPQTSDTPQPATASSWKEAPPSTKHPGASGTAHRPVPCLHIVHENRKYPAMTRLQVKGLLDSARLSGDDLICAIDGPWMRVADFFAKRSDSTPPEEWVEVEVDEDEVDDLEEVFDDDPPQFAARGGPPAIVPLLSDQWYVKVRGLHSMNLQKHHLKTLLAIREITIDNPVRHVHWDDEGWRPLREIPQLAELLK